MRTKSTLVLVGLFLTIIARYRQTGCAILVAFLQWALFRVRPHGVGYLESLPAQTAFEIVCGIPGARPQHVKCLGAASKIGQSEKNVIVIFRIMHAQVVDAGYSSSFPPTTLHVTPALSPTLFFPSHLALSGSIGILREFALMNIHTSSMVHCRPCWSPLTAYLPCLGRHSLNDDLPELDFTVSCVRSLSFFSTVPVISSDCAQVQEGMAIVHDDVCGILLETEKGGARTLQRMQWATFWVLGLAMYGRLLVKEISGVVVRLS